MIDKNVGGLDRWGRILGGVVVAVVGVTTGMGVLPVVGPLLGPIGGALLMMVAAVLLFTGSTQRCLVNYHLGRDTHGAGESD